MSDHFEKTAFLLKCLMDNMADHIYFKDLDSKFLMMNQAMAKWLGRESPTELVGKSDFDLFSPEHAEQAFTDEQRIITNDEPMYGKEEKETWPDGSETWVSTTKMSLKNEEGHTIGTFGISRDITAHKEAEFRVAKYAAEVKRYAEEMQRVKEEIEDDLRMAGELQKAFFPSSYPAFPQHAAPEDQLVNFLHYYQPGGLICGDLCSILKLSENEVGVFLCDVMGHGVRAALGTAVIRTLVDDISLCEKDPGRYLERMNKALIPVLRSTDEFIFATACYAVLNLSEGCVRIANAGHPVPVLISADGDIREAMEDPTRRGPALAIMENSNYETQTIPLSPGDAMVMFTDGIFETANADEEEYGEQRLLASIKKNNKRALPDLFQAVIQEASQFAKTKTFDDDVCLVGFRLKNTEN